MAISHVKQCAGCVHRQIEYVSHTYLGSVHIAAKLGRHYRAACLPACRSHANRTNKSVQWNVHRKIAVVSFESGSAGGMVDGIKPDSLRERLAKHGRVVG